VRFTGWEGCKNGGDVSIRSDDVRPNAQLGRPGGRVVLNLGFGGNPSWQCTVNREECLRRVAVHEFGHVLGFEHEQTRPDTVAHTCWGFENDSGNASTGNGISIGVWDLDSVMNYCNPGARGELSPTDIEGLQKYYGVGEDPCSFRVGPFQWSFCGASNPGGSVRVHGADRIRDGAGWLLT
jgi:hypothetical protein